MSYTGGRKKSGVLSFKSTPDFVSDSLILLLELHANAKLHLQRRARIVGKQVITRREIPDAKEVRIGGLKHLARPFIHTRVTVVGCCRGRELNVLELKDVEDFI